MISRICSKLTNSQFRKLFSTLAIKNGTIVNADRMFKGDVFVKGNIIKKITKTEGLGALPEGTRVIDASNKYVMPGGIDPHTHMEMPFMGTISYDDYDYGTKAAVSGGTTCLIDFIIPNKNKQQPLVEAYEEWQGRAEKKVNCDYSFHCGMTYWTDDSPQQMEKIVNLGIPSFKPFLAYKGSLMVNDETFYKIAKTCKKLGAMLQVHAENGDLIAEAQKELVEQGLTGPEFHYYSRPDQFEEEATNRAITIANHLTTPIYIVHVMSKLAAQVISRARSRNYLVYGETLASALGVDGQKTFNKDWDQAAGYIMSPPINLDPATKIYLMNQLACNVLQTTATDNCTFCKEQKRMGKDNFTKIPNGINGIEDRMSIIWTNGVNKGILSPSDFVRITSTNTAQIFNMYPQKGTISVDADADIVVWDPNKEKTISAKTHHHKTDFNIFEGMHVKGLADTTISRGQVVWENNKLNVKQGSGKFIKRLPFGPVFDRVATLTKNRDPAQFKVKRS